MRIGSLCSGYGGLDLAVEAVFDAHTVWLCEYDKHPSSILAQRFPGVPNHSDLTDTDWTQVEPVNILTAGYPCQPFSHAGKRQGTQDDRHLWPYIADAIRILRPRYVCLENVAGHLSLGFGDVLGDLAALGYDARWGVVRAADAGAPHNRARVFILAHPAGARLAGSKDAGASSGDEGARVRGSELERDGGPRTAADAGGGSLTGTTATRHGLPVASERGGPTTPDAPFADGVDDGSAPSSTRVGDWGATTDASGERHGRQQDPRAVGRVDREDAGETRQRERTRPQPQHRSAEATTDAEGVGWPRPIQPRQNVEHNGSEPAHPGQTWGTYAAAIRRWETILGRPAPAPTEPGRNGPRLAPPFVEWMMGLPAGWVTDTGIPRNAQLKALGNGVVPQQAALAYRTLAEVAA